MKKAFFLAVSLAAMLALPTFAFGQLKPFPSGLYVGGAVGQSKARDACDGVPISCDDSDTGWKIFIGYQFNDYFAVEGGYVDFGKAKANGTITGVTVSASAEANSWELVGVAGWPFTPQFSVYGKAGLHRWDLDVTATGSVPGFSVTASGSDKGTDFTFGLGAKYSITQNIIVRAEWQRYKDVGSDNTGGKSDIDLLSLGLLYRF